MLNNPAIYLICYVFRRFVIRGSHFPVCRVVVADVVLLYSSFVSRNIIVIKRIIVDVFNINIVLLDI
jgi:hypothetical protein